MHTRCDRCDRDYDDARCSTICPHDEFLTVAQAKQKDLGLTLLGKRVYFAGSGLAIGGANAAGLIRGARVVAVRWDGMVELDGMSGEFAPHLFVVAEEQ